MIKQLSKENSKILSEANNKNVKWRKLLTRILSMVNN